MNDMLYGHGDGFLTRDNGQRLFEVKLFATHRKWETERKDGRDFAE